MAGLRALSPNADQVRRLDNDRFLATLFAPAGPREALFALYAFNLEVARIPEMVSEPLLGAIRLQWWREAIDAIFAGAPPRHVAAAGLADAVRRFGLGRVHFDRLLDARALDLAEQPPADLAALVAYADGSCAALVHLALEALGAAGTAPGDGQGDSPGDGQGNGPENGQGDSDHGGGPGDDHGGGQGGGQGSYKSEGAPTPGTEAAGNAEKARAVAAAGRHVGIAWALTGLLRAVPFHAGARRLYLPRRLLDEAGIGAGDVFARRPSAGLAAVTRTVAEEARAHLAQARAVRARVPRAALPALLPAILAEAYLGRIERAGFDVFAGNLAIAAPGRQLRLLVAALGGRY